MYIQWDITQSHTEKTEIMLSKYDGPSEIIIL